MQISVIIPTYNRYDFLKHAIESIKLQTYQAYEIIIIDDGSIDNTSNIQQIFPDIKYIYQSNRGVSSARNRGIYEAKNDWIAFLDSDDVWYPDKLQTQVDFHNAHKHIMMSYTDEEWIRDGNKVNIPKKFQKIGKNIFLENLSYCDIAPSSVLLHASIFNRVGFFDENMEVCEDYDLWLRILMQYDVQLIQKKLIKKYAGHSDQLSYKYWGMDRFRVKSLEKIFNIASPKLKEIVRQELLKKYNLLLKGAYKYDKISDIQNYKNAFFELSSQETVQ